MYSVVKIRGLHRIFHSQCELCCDIAKASKCSKGYVLNAKKCVFHTLSHIPCTSALIQAFSAGAVCVIINVDINTKIFIIGDQSYSFY